MIQSAIINYFGRLLTAVVRARRYITAGLRPQWEPQRGNFALAQANYARIADFFSAVAACAATSAALAKVPA